MLAMTSKEELGGKMMLLLFGDERVFPERDRERESPHNK